MVDTTIETALRWATKALDRKSPSPRLDAELLLAHELECRRTDLVTRGATVIDEEVLDRFAETIAQRESGVPVAHLLGRREFWSLSLKVNPAVLIPRPDTETLVAAALEITGGRDTMVVADLGTGSGAIAVALAHERPRWRIVATDVDDQAIALAEHNAAKHRLHNIVFRTGDWCAALNDDAFDLVVCNPPYIADNDPHLTSGDVRFEPRGALAGGPDGLDAVRTIVACIPRHVRPGGWLLLEHGFDQGDAVVRLLADEGFSATRQWRDLGGRTRVTGAQIGRDA